ncbi:hypothetical protein OSC52_13395 [Clostridium pasteurianum]|uniref:hypothetical protein n=1 Tax=Clostridium pasteurianum TaxID=1501 RepID=UPI002260F3D4|nr:hypothetical protein [Clostridium pasteurianum]UZW12843.1 hypothetical protein OSC52_13395 [Clostridium pasteurianum]
MEFMELENVVNEIDNCKKEALESLGDIKANNEVEAMFKKCFEEIAKSLIDINFERLKQRIKNKEN